MRRSGEGVRGTPPMTAILAIDAAWTVQQPSGVALLVNVGGRWRCAGLAPSYQQFEKLADGEPVNWDLKPTGRRPDLDRLLAVCRQLLDGEQVSLIAMDMPLSLEPITGRRAAGNAAPDRPEELDLETIHCSRNTACRFSSQPPGRPRASPFQGEGRDDAMR